MAAEPVDAEFVTRVCRPAVRRQDSGSSSHIIEETVPAWQATDPRVVEDRLGDFDLLDELGRGAEGRVYLARQRTLADRRVVLKVTECAGEEHINLARLQHTHI